ncbi:hypothetical protein JRQ81_004479 [Phrynocephalus forsythii]|uniref:Uncharacterized protein n=1 Tax=Phrynocephalus forsythii TaxID=171643 RepID=A0A9Q0XFC3_9SAUR|nr:hypothetical protein JRQ81_004479 [Phrynocephalus forsythii]
MVAMQIMDAIWPALPYLPAQPITLLLSREAFFPASAAKVSGCAGECRPATVHMVTLMSNHHVTWILSDEVTAGPQMEIM